MSNSLSIMNNLLDIKIYQIKINQDKFKIIFNSVSTEGEAGGKLQLLATCCSSPGYVDPLLRAFHLNLGKTGVNKKSLFCTFMPDSFRTKKDKIARLLDSFLVTDSFRFFYY